MLGTIYKMQGIEGSWKEDECEQGDEGEDGCRGVRLSSPE